MHASSTLRMTSSLDPVLRVASVAVAAQTSAQSRFSRIHWRSSATISSARHASAQDVQAWAQAYASSIASMSALLTFPRTSGCFEIISCVCITDRPLVGCVGFQCPREWLPHGRSAGPPVQSQSPTNDSERNLMIRCRVQLHLLPPGRFDRREAQEHLPRRMLRGPDDRFGDGLGAEQRGTGCWRFGRLLRCRVDCGVFTAGRCPCVSRTALPSCISSVRKESVNVRIAALAAQ